MTYEQLVDFLVSKMKIYQTLLIELDELAVRIDNGISLNSYAETIARLKTEYSKTYQK